MMAYNEFSMESVIELLGITVHTDILFPNLKDAPVSVWLRETLNRGSQLSLISEKARSEFIVAPILLETRALCGERISILSGQKLDIDPARRLVGECDFIVALSEPLPYLQAPALMILEAKKNDIAAGLGQCVAQMVAARAFNATAGHPCDLMFGCVTTGMEWAFLRLDKTVLTIDTVHLFIIQVGAILATMQAAVNLASRAYINVS